MLSELLLKTSANKIFSFLTLHGESSFYDKEISEQSGVSRGATNQILNEFFKKNLVTRERRGKAWFYSVSDQPLVKYFRIYENLSNLCELVNQLRPIARRVILFGSAAKGTDTAESDVDLFVLTDNSRQVESTIQEYDIGREIKSVVLTPIEYATSQGKDKAFYEEVNKGIVLFEGEGDE